MACRLDFFFNQRGNLASWRTIWWYLFRKHRRKLCRYFHSPFQPTLVRDPRLRPEFFSGFLFATAWISCVYNCHDLPSNNSSLCSSHIWFSYIYNFIIILSRVYHEPIQRPTPGWLVSLIGRSLPTGIAEVKGSNPVQVRIFFQAFFSQLQKLRLWSTFI